MSFPSESRIGLRRGWLSLLLFGFYVFSCSAFPPAADNTVLFSFWHVPLFSECDLLSFAFVVTTALREIWLTCDNRVIMMISDNKNNTSKSALFYFYYTILAIYCIHNLLLFPHNTQSDFSDPWSQRRYCRRNTRKTKQNRSTIDSIAGRRKGKKENYRKDERKKKKRKRKYTSK